MTQAIARATTEDGAHSNGQDSSKYMIDGHVFDKAQNDVQKLMERDGFIRFKQSPLFVDFMKEVRGAQRELSLSKWTARFTDCARLPRTRARLCPCEIEARTRGGRKFGGGRPPLGPLVRGPELTTAALRRKQSTRS